jgi:hypothetical protein
MPFFPLPACGRVWLSLALLLALLWQALVIQAHVHVAPTVTASANAQAAAVTGPTPKNGDDPATCPICREMAHVGHYLAATPPFIRRSLARSSLWRSVPLRRWLTRKRSHAWQSRGPPARAA